MMIPSVVKAERNLLTLRALNAIWRLAKKVVTASVFPYPAGASKLMGLTKRREKKYVLFYEKSERSDYNCIPFSASQPLIVSSLSGNAAFVNQTGWQ
jgi:hypothetical protein